MSESTGLPHEANGLEQDEAFAGFLEDAERREAERTEAMRRELPDVPDARAALVEQWAEVLRYAREFHKPAFKRMRWSMKFARGKQWPHMMVPSGSGEPAEAELAGWNDKSFYVANITMRHVSQRVSSLYARNPKVAVRPRARLLNSVWDGTGGQVMAALQQTQMAAQQGAQPPVEAAMILQDYQDTEKKKKDAARFARTMELLLDHFVGEQAISYKGQMKSAVRRAVTCGVAYVKLGFQREMQMRPDAEARINDASTRLAVLERLSAELADGEADEYSAEAEQLRLSMAALKADGEEVRREGLVYDFPLATSILPDPRCTDLQGFVGADWVAQDYLMTTDEVMEVYGIDVKAGGHAAYASPGAYQAGQVAQIAQAVADGDKDTARSAASVCLVTEIYSRKDGLVYHYCDGYPDFLREPAAPEFYLERFWPWVPLVFNACEDTDELFPPSDVELIQDMQVDYNRGRQGLREHRKASRPKVVAPRGALDDADQETLADHPTDGIALIQLNGLQPGQKIEDLLQPLKLPGIDQNVYDVRQTFEDMLRVVGTQEANLGPTNGDGTATESAIAESSRMSSLSSSVDEIDEVLSEVARSSAQILLSEMGEQQVKEIVGPGAIWPQLTQTEIARELTVSVVAGSTGRPNRAVKINEFKAMMPFLERIPGLDPEKMLDFALRLLDENLDVTTFMKSGMPSISSMNSAQPNMSGMPGSAPTEQGAGVGQGAQAPVGGGPAPEEGPQGGGVPNLPRPETHGMARRFLT